MEANVYAPPAAVVMDAPQAGTPEFYVVSKTKFLALFFVTLGAYQLYWFYKHWARYRRFHRARLSPAARAIFAIFFTHSLGDEIAQRLTRAGSSHRWSPGALAAGYVLFQVTGSISDRLAGYGIGSPYTDLFGLLSLMPVGYCLWSMQNAANIACGDAHGDSNRTFTWANWLWMALGALLWAMVLLGLAITFGWFPENG